VAYTRSFEGKRDIWIVPASGGAAIPFAHDPAADFVPTWSSPDLRRIAFVSFRDGHENVWSGEVREGQPVGAPRQLTTGIMAKKYPAWSPRGDVIAFVGSDAAGSDAWTAPADGSRPPRRLTTGAGIVFVRWMPSGLELAAAGTWRGSRLSIRRVALDGSTRAFDPPIEIGHPDEFPAFDISRDGRLIVHSRARWLGDIWVAERQTR
jgi:hypothetical protein